MTDLVLPGYRDISLVGQGGLGRVFRAVRESTGGVVAIKELRDVASASPAWHRARRELEAMLLLKGHPYVVSVEEIVEGPAGPCIVMEFVAGGSLNDRVSGGVGMPVEEVVLVGQQVSQALVAAHDAGIVHRDIKPHNVLIGSFGQVKVCDFGISSLSKGADGRTQTSALTLAYASPEELDGDAAVGPAADVYSFAATMAHLLTGRKSSFRERLAGQQIDVGANSVVDPTIAPLRNALSLCLAHRPEDRPTMRQMSSVFERAAEALGPRRIGQLPVTGTPDVTVKRVRSAPDQSAFGAGILTPAVAPPPAPSWDIPPPSSNMPPPPSNIQSPPSWDIPPPATIVRPLIVGPVVDMPSPYAQPEKFRVKVALAAAAVVLVGAAVAVMLFKGKADTVSSSSTTTTIVGAVESSRVAITAPAKTAAATVPVTAAQLPSATRAAEIPTTVVVAPPVTSAQTIPPAPTNPPTVPPTVPRPTFAPLTADEATQAFSNYLAIGASGDFQTAWSMLTPRYQAKYLGFDHFVKFWATVQGAGMRNSQSIGTVPNGQSLRMSVWYGRRKDGTVSNEIVDADLIKDNQTGATLIDDYRPIGPA
jgi:eukaryotic-like serine/threonine-protein kinase